MATQRSHFQLLMATLLGFSFDWREFWIHPREDAARLEGQHLDYMLTNTKPVALRDCIEASF